MQIRDNGKEVKFYFATVQPVVFSLPPDFDATGKTFSLAIRAERDVNTPALAEATGTVSAQLVTFSVDTDTQSFLDALRAGVSRAWLEIYVGDENVLLQRPVSIEPRAGSLEGQPPAPIKLYYTAAETDALLAGKEAAGTAQTLVSAHNTASNAHPGTFDRAGAATSAVQEHNDAATAHGGRLLAVAPNGGAVMAYRDNEWIAQVGDYMQNISGDFTAEPGVVYGLELTENKSIYIEVASSTDFDFALVVTMGATLRSLALLPDMVNAILWSDGGNPPDYSIANPAPALDTTLATYTLRFRYVAAENALHAELASTKDYNLPISGTRGVFTSSGSTPVASAMVVSGGTLGTGSPATTALIFSRGQAVAQTVAAGGSITVSSGGIATSAVLSSGGRMNVSSGGAASDTTVSSGCSAVVSSGGSAMNTTVLFGGRCYAEASGSIISATCESTGIVHARGVGAVVSSVAASGYVYVLLSATARDVTIESNGFCNTSAKASISGAVIKRGGTMVVASAGTATNADVKSGGKLTVSSGGLALNVTAENPADVVVIEGGTIYPPLS